MSAKSKAKVEPLTQEEINTYFHERIKRLERSSGLKIHPHPDRFNRDEAAEDAARAEAEAKRQEELRAAEAARAEEEAANRAELESADDDGAIVPRAPKDE